MDRKTVSPRSIPGLFLSLFLFIVSCTTQNLISTFYCYSSHCIIPSIFSGFYMLVLSCIGQGFEQRRRPQVNQWRWDDSSQLASKNFRNKKNTVCLFVYTQLYSVQKNIRFPKGCGFFPCPYNSR